MNPGLDADLLARVGAWISRHRAERRWSQAELAERVDISPHFVGMLERGLRMPAVPTLVALARVFGASLDELLVTVSGTELPKPTRGRPPRRARQAPAGDVLSLREPNQPWGASASRELLDLGRELAELDTRERAMVLTMVRALADARRAARPPIERPRRSPDRRGA